MQLRALDPLGHARPAEMREQTICSWPGPVKNRIEHVMEASIGKEVPMNQACLMDNGTALSTVKTLETCMSADTQFQLLRSLSAPQKRLGKTHHVNALS